MTWKMLLNNYFKQLINAIIAGVLIALSCVFYLVGIKVINNGFVHVISCFGFLFIALYNYDFFSGKIGYSLENKVPYILDCIIALLGNFIGAWIVALIMKVTSFDLNNGLEELKLILDNRIETGLSLDALIKSFIAGIVIYFTFNTYKKAEQPIARFSAILLGSVIIYGLGFNEVVSELFYCNIGVLYGYEYKLLMTNIIYVLIGNSLGALFVPVLRKLKQSFR